MCAQQRELSSHVAQQRELSSHVCTHVNNENLAKHLLRTPSRRPLEQGEADIEHQEDDRLSDMCGRMLDRRRSRRRCFSDAFDMNAAVDDGDAPRNSRLTAAKRMHEHRLTRAPKMPRFESHRCTDIYLMPRLEPCRKSSSQPELLVCSLVNVVS